MRSDVAVCCCYIPESQGKLDSAPRALFHPFRRKSQNTPHPDAKALSRRVAARSGLELLRCRQEIAARPESSWVSFPSASFTPMPPGPVTPRTPQHTAWFQKMCRCAGEGVSWYGGGGSWYNGLVQGERAKQDDAPLPKSNTPLPLASRPQRIAKRRCTLHGRVRGYITRLFLTQGKWVQWRFGVACKRKCKDKANKSARQASHSHTFKSTPRFTLPISFAMRLLVQALYQVL